jgi:hypothetical protein
LRLEALEDRFVPTVTYHGGNLLFHVEVQGVYLGSAWQNNSSLFQSTGQYEAYLGDIVNSGYFDMLSDTGPGHYAIGRGSSTPGVIIPKSLNSNFFLQDSTIRSTLQTYITNGSLASPDANRLYVVFVEPDIAVQMGQGGAESIHNFLGYHGAYAGRSASGFAADIRYAIITYPNGRVHNAGVPGLTPFQDATEVASHEIVEAATDPDVNYKTLGWYDDDYNEEISDLANARYGTYHGYVVQFQVDQHDRPIFPSDGNTTQTGTTFNVGVFPGNGVWRYSSATGWQQLTTLDATAASADPYGDVVAEFPGIGVWEYVDVIGWDQLTAVDATLVTIDANGDVYAEFPGAGVWFYNYGIGWNQLTPYDASLLASNSEGDVVGEFPGSGVWRYDPSAGWQQLTTLDAYAVAIDANGNVAASILGSGTWMFRNDGSWARLTTLAASSLAFDPNGNLGGEFQGYGVWLYTGGPGWRRLTPYDATMITTDDNGNLLGEFPGIGVWRYSSTTGWQQISALDASVLL